MGLFGDSDQRHGAAMSKQTEVSVETVWQRHCIQDEIELARLSIHLVRIPRDDNLLRT